MSARAGPLGVAESLASALVLVLGLSACGGEDAAPAPGAGKRSAAVSVSPALGGPRTTFVLKARNLRSARAEYGFRLRGPGGPSCEGRLSARFVMGTGVTPATARRGYERRYIPPQRQDPLTPSVVRGYDRRAQKAPWCPGSYRLAVKRVDSLWQRPSKPIGTASFTVGRSGRASGPRRPSHGVSEANLGKEIIETPYREVLARYGRPKTVPREYRRVEGQPCIYYDIVGPGAYPPRSFLAVLFRLCFRKRRVDHAAGSNYVVLPGPRARTRR